MLLREWDSLTLLVLLWFRPPCLLSYIAGVPMQLFLLDRLGEGVLQSIPPALPLNVSLQNFFIKVFLHWKAVILGLSK